MKNWLIMAVKNIEFFFPQFLCIYAVRYLGFDFVNMLFFIIVNKLFQFNFFNSSPKSSISKFSEIIISVVYLSKVILNVYTQNNYTFLNFFSLILIILTKIRQKNLYPFFNILNRDIKVITKYFEFMSKRTDLKTYASILTKPYLKT
ncbi:hypothetical protein BpHYR1_037860 [Brachionus plicatilis]|uniref:Uncharacterized protein n=1 Tax=Brachionus plicatilis TaxID=10195 RepID=A0A3M7RQX1_BRAPC|nr:hypothetical protein BpHYR1_037860 [Brachionus plicatilis]